MTTDYDTWIDEMQKLILAREENKKAFQESQPLDVQKLSSLDHSADVTAFINKLSNISPTTINELMQDLDRLNLSNHLDKIALIICKTKVEEANSTAELALVGIFGDNKGLKFIGHVLALFVNTDKQEHLKSSILLPFCKAHFYPITGILPYSIRQYTKILPASKEVNLDTRQRDIIIKILEDYRKSLVQHTNKKYEEMIKLEMSLKTGGASSSTASQCFDQTKQHFERLLEYENELSEVLGQAPMQFPQGKVSVDEREAVVNVNLSIEKVNQVMDNNSIKHGSTANTLPESPQPENARSNLLPENFQMESNTPPNSGAWNFISNAYNHCRRSISTYYRRSRRSVSQVCSINVNVLGLIIACAGLGVAVWVFMHSRVEAFGNTLDKRLDRFEKDLKNDFNLQFRARKKNKMTQIYGNWILEMQKNVETRQKNIKFLEESQPFDDQRLRSLDATLKKVTAFTKKLKNVSSTTINQLLPDLDKLNLSKYLDEIAFNICEAKIKIADLTSLIDFIVKISSLYNQFSTHLLNEFKKQMPSKKTDKVENPSKLRVDLRFFTELLLNGIFGREGLQLLGAVLAFLVNTDKQEHLNTSVLMPFCKAHFFPITGILPFTIQKEIGESEEHKEEHTKLIST
uniref:Transmembrane protein n=1 Tax=Meloidogyne javanica TaxID=6303 RepID=A0A915LWT8_MELJA